MIYDENWEHKNFSNAIRNPAFMVTVDNMIYISASNAVYKTDKHINIINSYNQTDKAFRGIYYDKPTESLFVAVSSNQTIDNSIIMLDRNLTFLDSINITVNIPFSLNGYDGKLFVGTTGGKILAIQNKTIIISINTLCGATVSSLLIDDFGYMVVLCYRNLNSYIYHTNGSLIGDFTKFDNTLNVNFDTKGRLIINSDTHFDIYY